MSDPYVTVAVAAAALTLGATACAALAIGGMFIAAGTVARKSPPGVTEARAL